MACLTLLLSLVPCEAENVSDSLTVGIQSIKTPAIRPLEPRERDIVSIYNLIYEPLFTIDDDYLPQPCLCESWEDNGRTWTFRLREDITFSDGTPLTANDVVATAQAIIDKANSGGNDLGYYGNLKYFVKSISATNEHTVVVRAERRYYGLLYAMTFPVLKASEVNADNPAGTGPYAVTVFEAGDYMWLQANTLWWQSQPQVKEIMVTMHQTPGQVMESYEYARVQAIFSRSLAASQYKSGASSISIASRTNQLETLVMNESSFPLGDVNVRKAIRYAVDVDRIANNVYMGMVTRTDLPTIPGTWLYDESLSGYFATNRDEAVRLLEESGWADSDGDGVLDQPKEDGSGLRRLHLRIFVYEEPENDVRVETANLIADMLAPIGIECEVKTMTFTDIQERLKAGGFDLALLSYAMDVCPDPGFLLMRANTGNYFRYKSEETTELCKTLRTETTKDGYQATLFRIWRKFAEDSPFICLFYRDGAVLTRKMYTTVRDIRELELLRGIESFRTD